MVEKCKFLNKTAVFFSYIIAFEARYKAGLQDCDVNSQINLCFKGAQFIKDNRQYLVNRYKYQSSKIAQILVEILD